MKATLKPTVKQVVGIDVAQKELVVCLAKLYEDLNSELCISYTFANNTKGFTSLLQWAAKHSTPNVVVHYVMEATGVYHEGLAYFLKDQAQQVSVVLPTKISNYIRTLDTKTITDKTAAQAIARFGLERKLDGWEKPKPVYKQLRQLTREREQLIAERTMAKNQLHAEQAEAEPNKSSPKRLNERIKLLNRQEAEIKTELDQLIQQDATTSEAVERLCTIPGIGLLTAATVLAETNGFELIRNKRQLTSYAGLDIVEKQSGTSVKAKPKISKRGNKFLRKAMHMAALAAIRHDERYKAVCSRVISRSAVKMKGAVAVQRKLLEMTYTLFKTKKDYDKDYLNPKAATDSQLEEVKSEKEDVEMQVV